MAASIALALYSSSYLVLRVGGRLQNVMLPEAPYAEIWVRANGRWEPNDPLLDAYRPLIAVEEWLHDGTSDS